MESTLTDPTPFITAAYIISACGLFGFALWLIRERKNLLTKIAFLESENLHKKGK
jgi:hypothetical protein